MTNTSTKFSLASLYDKVREQTATLDKPDVTFAELGELIALAMAGRKTDDSLSRVERYHSQLLFGAIRASGGVLKIFEDDLCDWSPETIFKVERTSTGETRYSLEPRP